MWCHGNGLAYPGILRKRFAIMEMGCVLVALVLVFSLSEGAEDSCRPCLCIGKVMRCHGNSVEDYPQVDEEEKITTDVFIIKNKKHWEFEYPKSPQAAQNCCHWKHLDILQNDWGLQDKTQAIGNYYRLQQIEDKNLCIWDSDWINISNNQNNCQWWW